MDVSDLPAVIACLITSIVTILRYKRPGETVGFIWKEPIYGENLSGYALPQRSHGFQNLRGDRWVVWSFQISHWTGKFLFRSIAEDMLRLCHGKKWKSSLSIKKFDIVKYGFRKMKRPITDTWHKDFTISEKRIGCAVMRVLLRMTGFWIEKTLVKYMALKKWYLRQHLHDARKSLSTAIESMRSSLRCLVPWQLSHMVKLRSVGVALYDKLCIMLKKSEIAQTSENAALYNGILYI